MQIVRVEAIKWRSWNGLMCMLGKWLFLENRYSLLSLQNKLNESHSTVNKSYSVDFWIKKNKILQATTVPWLVQWQLVFPPILCTFPNWTIAVHFGVTFYINKLLSSFVFRILSSPINWFLSSVLKLLMLGELIKVQRDFWLCFIR